MSTAEPTFSWGADVETRRGSSARRARSRRHSLLWVRAEAVLIDGLVLLIPVLGAAWLASLLFPHKGFFLASSEAAPGTRGASVHLQAPGALLISALALSYFYVCEAAFGQTLGKRRRGLWVQSSGGGDAGCNAVSARTVLRLIDGLAFYLLGALIALLTGRRRRRIGDWAGRTVVVFDDGARPAHRRPALWQLAAYPAAWLALVVLAVFGLGLGTAVSEGEAAIALVRAYSQARERGDAQLACSMLTAGQQQELVAIESGRYGGIAGGCPAFILRENPRSHLLNPLLPALARSTLTTAYSPLGVVAVFSRETPGYALIAVREGGRLKLDVRGYERAEFVHSCAAAGSVRTSVCACAFDRARAEGGLPEGTPTPSQIAVLRSDVLSCGGPAATSSGLHEAPARQASP
ncbi:MAG TPA: RDD family protein [Solirubrobacteraceae bacterium]|jgi:uncharacterized RDD family membrane protein YckC|nr:RDD family protein [Solirubrobacteraceae bacterium]